MTGHLPLEDAAQRFPRAVAYCDGQRRVIYQQLHEDVEQRTRALLDGGLSPGTRVAWVPRNDYETLVRFWAILHAGGVAVPASHRLAPAIRSEIVQNLQSHWLETRQNATENPSEVAPRNLQAPATVVLSSGSTGTPKAIVHSLESHIANARGAATRIPLGPGDGWLWALPVSHVSGLSVMIRCAVAGAAICGVAEQAELGRGLESRDVTHVSLVPTQLHRLLDAGADLSRLKAVLVGGMATAESLLERAIRCGVPVHVTYGMTEMASQVATSDRLHRPQASSGFVLPDREVSIGADDEILVRGACLGMGYAVGDGIQPMVAADGWFRTGDRGRLSTTGELEVLGRIDHMFVCGGENVYPEAIEAELLRIPEIRQAIVVPKQDEALGHRPVAIVDAPRMDVMEWERQLRERLAGFEIPRTFYPWPQGEQLAIKPDRTRLRDLANRLQN